MSRARWLPVLLILVSCQGGGAGAGPASADVADAGVDSGPGFAAGQQLPALTFLDCLGQPVGTSDLLAGASALLLTVHAGWCTVCQGQHGDLEALAAIWAPRGLQVALVLGDASSGGEERVGEAACAAYRDAHGFPFPVLRDEGFAETRAFAGAALPATLLVDGGGTVRLSLHGWEADFHRPLVEATLDELL